jgi:hypothetical protein
VRFGWENGNPVAPSVSSKAIMAAGERSGDAMTLAEGIKVSRSILDILESKRSEFLRNARSLCLAAESCPSANGHFCLKTASQGSVSSFYRGR